MTPFLALQSASGLSNREAADYLGIRESTIEDWRRGRKSAPPDRLAAMAALVERQAVAADEAASEVAARLPDGAEIEIGYPADDHEAQSLGWPNVGAWRAMAGLVIAILIEDGRDPKSIRLVPRGSTPATAAAADAHGR